MSTSSLDILPSASGVRRSSEQIAYASVAWPSY